MASGSVQKLPQTQLGRLIRTWSKESINVSISDHAKQRMRERNVSALELFECLQKGSLERTEPNLKFGTLECRMERFTCGRNLAVVVAVDDNSPPVVVVTSIVVRKKRK